MRMNKQADFKEFTDSLKKRSRIEGIVLIVVGLIVLFIIVPHFFNFGKGFPFVACFSSLVPIAVLSVGIYKIAAFRKQIGRMEKMAGMSSEEFELLFEESSPLASGNDYYFIGGGFILNFSSFRTYPVNAVTKLKKSMTPADENSSSRYHVEIKLDKSLAGVSRDILSFSYCSERDQAYSAISDNYYSLTGSYPDGWEKYNK